MDLVLHGSNVGFITPGGFAGLVAALLLVVYGLHQYLNVKAATAAAKLACLLAAARKDGAREEQEKLPQLLKAEREAHDAAKAEGAREAQEALIRRLGMPPGNWKMEMMQNTPYGRDHPYGRVYFHNGQGTIFHLSVQRREESYLEWILGGERDYPTLYPQPGAR